MTKIKIALATMLVLGSVSVAMAAPRHEKAQPGAQSEHYFDRQNQNADSEGGAGG